MICWIFIFCAAILFSEFEPIRLHHESIQCYSDDELRIHNFVNECQMAELNSKVYGILLIHYTGVTLLETR